MPHENPLQRGFTLAEVLVALVLLSTVAAGLMQIAVSARRMTPAQMDRAAAMNLAQGKAETLYESVRQDQWNLANYPLSASTNLGAAQNVSVGGKTYSRSYVVSPVNLSGDGGAQDYRKVVVTVQ